ncbi:bifunctional ADP-dependent NAD(P)H-hydrate dehydratase/NAD(P)H-hydrate epimerase [Clostridium carnis]
MYILPVDKCKELDKYAIEKVGIPSIVLMENAASEVTKRIVSMGNSFLIFCGEGNNGGDGLAIARKLLLAGKEVLVVVVSERGKYTDDFQTNFKILKNMNSKIKYIKDIDNDSLIRNELNHYDVVLDCIFGVGLNRNLNCFYSGIIKFINEIKGIKISIDVPSGLNGNTGKSMGEVVKAHITYSFEVIKLGFLKYSALEYLGELEIISIGIPSYIKDLHNTKIVTLDKEEYSKRLINRYVYGHKGTYGKSVIFAGSKGYTGAAYISAEACVKAGAGLTTVITTSYVQDVLSNKLIEAMTADINEVKVVESIVKNSNVIAFGPGLKVGEDWEKRLKKIIEETKIDFVIDAGGLSMIANDNDIVKKLSGRAVLTPHPGEMARLIGRTIEYVEENRIDVAKEYAKSNNIVLLLKGYNTVITDGEWVYINKTGNSKMASGGMGDCLTGIITALIAQGHSKIDAAVLGAYIHGLAGEQCGKNHYSITANMIIEKISKVMESI